MKSLKIFLALLFLFAAVPGSFGQQKPEPVLIDEFGQINCEEFLARLDRFLVDLSNDPTAVGYAIIDGKKENTRQSFGYRSQLRGWIKFRGFDSSRIIIMRRENTEKLKIQLWLAPAGANLSDSSDLGWKYPLTIAKPLSVYNEADSDGVCPGDGTIRFSESLREYPHIRGHLVIHAKTLKEFSKRKKELLNEFSEIAPGRLRFTYVRHKSDTFVEYWLVPPPQKRN